MAEYKTLYDRARYYDIVLARDIATEIDFIMACFQHYCGRPLQSLVDIACGPGYHALGVAAHGVQVYGVDLMETMIDLAREKAAVAAAPAEFYVADMRHFELPQAVDMAICVFDGMDALTDNEDVVQHLRTVASQLAPDGLYLLHNSHPRYTNLLQYGSYRYAAERDGVAVDLRWAVNEPVVDLVRSVAHVQIELHVRENGEDFIIADSATERIITPQEIALLCRLSGVFEVVGWYGDFRLDQPLDNSPQSVHMIAILRKIGNL